MAIYIPPKKKYYNPQPDEEIGDWLLNTFLEFGISQVFGIPGAAIEPFFNALGRAQRNNKINFTTVKHETAAAFAAEGYFRFSGKPAVCCSTAAPGITNLITGVANAKIERIPLIVITAQVPMKDFESGAPQDSATHYLDAQNLMSEVCTYSTLITHPHQIINKLCFGLSLLQGASPGPIHFSFPLDILKQKINDLNFDFPTPFQIVSSMAKHENTISNEKFAELTTIIQAFGENVTLYFGKDVSRSSECFIKIATALNWTLLCSPEGKGLIDHDHPQFKGVTGLAGHNFAAKHLTTTNDLIVLLGTTFDQSCNGGWNIMDFPHKRMIQINQTPAEIQAYVPTTLRISCDMNDLSMRLAKTLKVPLRSVEQQFTAKRPDYIDDYHWRLMNSKTANTDRIKPQTFIGGLNQLAGSTVPICADCSSSFLWAIHLWKSKPKLRSATANNFHVTTTFGSMGWAISSSMGIAQAIKEAGSDIPAICITGDGSYLMSSQEIGTAAQLNLRLAIFILNDSSYGLVQHCQKIVGAEQIATQLPDIDFTKIAQAQGIKGYHIRNSNDLTFAWSDFQRGQGPALFDVYIDTEEIPPFGNRLKNLGFKSK